MKKTALSLVLAILFLFLKPIHAKATDLRDLQMHAVLEEYHSPMTGFEHELIQIAQDNNLDWTLMAAIAGTESSFGLHMPANCLNPYGWGIYGDHKLCFADFAEAASTVSSGLSSRYNTSSLESIGRTYNQVSTEGWIAHTRYFMNKIKQASIPVSSLPIEL